MYVVTPEAHAYVVPNFGERDGQEPRVHDVDEPVPTVTSQGSGKPRLPHAGGDLLPSMPGSIPAGSCP